MGVPKNEAKKSNSTPRQPEAFFNQTDKLISFKYLQSGHTILDSKVSVHMITFESSMVYPKKATEDFTQEKKIKNQVN